MPATDIREAADVTQHFAERIGLLPGNGERQIPPEEMPQIVRRLGSSVSLYVLPTSGRIPSSRKCAIHC